MKKINKKQKGFSILAVILVIVAVIVVIGVWALSGQTNTSNYSNNSDDITAAAIINDSSSIKLAFDNLIVNGNSVNSIVFTPGTPSTPAAPNILDPQTGLQFSPLSTKYLTENPNVNQGLWRYGDARISNAVNLHNVKIVIISGVKDNICKRINYSLYGVNSIPTMLGGNGNTNWKNPLPNLGLATIIFSMGNMNSTGSVNDQVYNNFVSDMMTKEAYIDKICININGVVADNNAYFRILKVLE